MYKLPALVRRRVAASLLGAFLSVFVGQFLCLCFGVQVRSLVQVGLATTATTPAHASTYEHEHQAAPAASQQHGHDSADEKPEKSDECCRDKTSAFFASLTHPPQHSLDKAVPLDLALPPTGSFAVAQFLAWNRTQPVLLVPPAQLKPKIPDIRVFIGSLTI